MRGETCAAVFLSVCAVRDLRTLTVQREMLCFWGLAAIFLYRPGTLQQAVLQLGAGTLWLLAARLSGGIAGEGDGWCLLLCSLTAGTGKTVQIALIASVAAAGTALMILRSGDGDCRLPFIPYLAAAAWLVLALDCLMPV